MYKRNKEQNTVQKIPYRHYAIKYKERVKVRPYFYSNSLYCTQYCILYHRSSTSTEGILCSAISGCSAFRLALHFIGVVLVLVQCTSSTVGMLSGLSAVGLAL